MRKLLGLATMAVMALFVVGCEKELKMTFVNTTDQARDLRIQSPSTGTDSWGTVPRNGRVTQKMKFDKDTLPTSVAWQAGDLNGSFSVDKDTKDGIIYIGEGGSTGLVSPKSELNKHKEVEKKDKVKSQDTIVD